MRSWLLFSFLLFTIAIRGQSLAGKECLHPTIVKFYPNGPQVLSEEGVLNYDHKEQVMVGYHDGNTESKWYKFIAAFDFKFSFKIWSDNPASHYGFFVYKKENSGFFCDNLARGLSKPVESVIFKEKIGILGIGILPTVNHELTDTLKYNKSTLLYDVPYKNAIDVKKGDTLFLNVYRYAGDDCGHHIWISTNEFVSKLRCLSNVCDKVEPARRIQVTPFFDSTEIKLEKFLLERNRPDPIVAEIEVLDTLTNEPLQVQLYNGIDRTYSSMLFQTDQSGKSTFTFYQDTLFLIHRVGYHPKIIHFNRAGEHTKSIALRKIERGEKFILEHIYFKTNSSQIQLTSRPEIKKLAKFLEENHKYKIEVQGHTNGQSKIRKDRHLKGQFHGTEIKLSRLRAEAVKKELGTMGIKLKRIKTKGYGGKNMLYPFPKNTMEHDRNKRVEVVIL